MPVEYPRTVDDAWWRLRSLRHRPPDFAARGERKDTFSAALEQSEQFFRAADSVGYESKPVMLYYGLSQASQAILAAKQDPRVNKQTATGHGTDCPNRGQITDVGDLEVCDARTRTGAPPKGGAFQLLGGVLDSPTLPTGIPLRQLWISLPEGVELPPTKAGNLFGAVLLERHDGHDYSKAFQATTGRVGKLAHLPYDLMPLDVAEVERQIIERYPALRNFRVMPNWQGCPDVAHWVLLLDPPGLRTSLSFDRGDRPMEHSEVFGMVELGRRVYGDGATKSIWRPPTLAGNTAPLHPLATWYAVLFGLSELARYQPTTWARAININTSADATALEHLMGTAHLACVNLIAELFEIRHPPHDNQPEGWRQHNERVHTWQRQQQNT